MRLCDAFAETLFRFRQEFKAIDVAEASGLSANQLSSFQRGGNLRSDSIDRLLDALLQLNPESKLYMLARVADFESLPLQGFEAPPPPEFEKNRELNHELSRLAS